MSRSRRKNRKGVAKTSAAPNFWGTEHPVPTVIESVRATDEPTALVRSLGPAPLTGHEKVADAYFTAIYARASGVAAALAMTSGLLDASSSDD